MLEAAIIGSGRSTPGLFTRRRRMRRLRRASRRWTLAFTRKPPGGRTVEGCEVPRLSAETRGFSSFPASTCLELRLVEVSCEPTTHRGAWRVTTTVNASWRRGSAGTATCLVEKCRLLGHPPGSGELATGARVDPPSAADRAFPAGIPGKLIPHLASPQSLVRHGNGSAGRNLHARRYVASATHLHDALSVRRDRNSTMRCRKKLYDALSVRTKPYCEPTVHR